MAYTGDKKREYQLAFVEKRRSAWIESQGGKCVKCGSVEDLEVDHIDSSLKTMQPAGIWSRTAVVRERELANCQVLCSICHQAKTTAEALVGHGTAACYNRGCRCSVCREFKKLAMRDYRARMKLIPFSSVG